MEAADITKDYLMGHFTEARIIAVVDKNATAWGSCELRVRMSWGCQRLLPANVVAISLSDASSELGYFQETNYDKDGRGTSVRQKSPPLGIPLGSAKVGLQNEYRKHVRDVVLNDLDQYVSIAYRSKPPQLPERILGAVCHVFQMESVGKNKVGDTRTLDMLLRCFQC